jgi:hypothetical protein
MKPADYISRLTQESDVSVNSEADKRILGDALEHLERVRQTKPTETRLDIWRIVMKSKITTFSAAAAAMVVVGILFLFGGGQKTLYAQIAEAFEKVQTLHAVFEEYRDGRWFKEHEIWYDRQAGIIEQERYEEHTDIRIDNGQQEWRYSVSGGLVAQDASYRDMDTYARDFCIDWLRFDPNREPAGDKLVGGVPCRMYVLSDPHQQCRIWVDEKKRVRGAELMRRSFEQEIESRLTVEYDVPVGSNRFLPPSGPDAKTIDVTQYIEQQFPLETAIFSRETMGLVFAVHRLEHCDNGLKYLVCSNRLTDETLPKLDDGNPWNYYGQFRLFARWDDVSEMNLDRPILLARMKHDGIQLDWYVLLSADNKTKQAPMCDVDVVVSTANQLKQWCRAKGLPTNDKFRLNVPVQEPAGEQLSLEEIAHEVYSLGSLYDPMVHSFLLTAVVKTPAGERSQVWKRPCIELGEDEYIKEIKLRVKM